jgi:hypothetical protein
MSYLAKIIFHISVEKGYKSYLSLLIIQIQSFSRKWLIFPGKLTIMFKLCTNKNHSYKHNEQIIKQNIDNSECFGVKFVKIYPEITSQ